LRILDLKIFEPNDFGFWIADFGSENIRT